MSNVFWTVVWVMFQIYCIVNVAILFVVANWTWRRGTAPTWVLTNDGKADFILGRILLWPYFGITALVRGLRTRKVQVRRVDQ